MKVLHATCMSFKFYSSFLRLSICFVQHLKLHSFSGFLSSSFYITEQILVQQFSLLAVSFFVISPSNDKPISKKYFIENSSNKPCISFRWHTVLKSMMKTHEVQLRPALDINHLFFQHTHSLVTQYATQLSDQLSQYFRACAQVALILFHMVSRCKKSNTGSSDRRTRSYGVFSLHENVKIQYNSSREREQQKNICMIFIFLSSFSFTIVVILLHFPFYKLKFSMGIQV